MGINTAMTRRQSSLLKLVYPLFVLLRVRATDPPIFISLASRNTLIISLKNALVTVTLSNIGERVIAAELIYLLYD